MTVRLVTPFGSTAYVEEATFVADSCLGPLLKGWTRFDGQLWPEDICLHRLETALAWEIL